MGRFAEEYRRHLGASSSALLLYGGFAALSIGFVLAALGILIVVSGDTIIDAHAQRNGLGIRFASLGLPLIFMGAQLTLPSRLVVHLLAGLGAVVCFIGVAMFNQAWPHEFSPRAENDRSTSIIAVYALGLVVLVTTTAMALVVNFVTRHTLLPGLGADDDIYADPDRPVTMEEVMRDIEREVGRQRLTWGGMEEDRLPRTYLKLKSGFGKGATVSSGKAGTVTSTVAKEMDVAFEALARLRGREGREISGEDDTATAIQALRALRRARQAELEASWWFRFKRWLVALFTGKRPGDPQATPILDDRNKPNKEKGSTSRAPPPPADGEPGEDAGAAAAVTANPSPAGRSAAPQPRKSRATPRGRAPKAAKNVKAGGTTSRPGRSRARGTSKKVARKGARKTAKKSARKRKK